MPEGPTGRRWTIAATAWRHQRREVLTGAVVAARSFQQHHERALRIVQRLGHLSVTLSTSRCNRRLHALGDWCLLIPKVCGARGEAHHR